MNRFRIITIHDKAKEKNWMDEHLHTVVFHLVLIRFSCVIQHHASVKDDSGRLILTLTRNLVPSKEVITSIVR